MFRINETILSEEIATTRFACDVTRCKGACCVIGNAGAPVDAEEVPHLEQAWMMFEDRLRPEARALVAEKGVVTQAEDGSIELNCVDDGECIFVTYRDGIAECAIQSAYLAGEFDWEKPISCHLFPIRLHRVDDIEFANYQYVPELCSSACENAKEKKIWLSDFLKGPLTRRYGREWVEMFDMACREIRSDLGMEDSQ